MAHRGTASDLRSTITSGMLPWTATNQLGENLRVWNRHAPHGTLTAAEAAPSASSLRPSPCTVGVGAGTLVTVHPHERLCKQARGRRPSSLLQGCTPAAVYEKQHACSAYTSKRSPSTCRPKLCWIKATPA